LLTPAQPRVSSVATLMSKASFESAPCSPLTRALSRCDSHQTVDGSLYPPHDDSTHSSKVKDSICYIHKMIERCTRGNGTRET